MFRGVSDDKVCHWFARIDGDPAKIAEARALVEVLFEKNTGEKLNWAVLEVER